MAMVIQSSDAAKVKSFGKLNLHEHQKWRNEWRTNVPLLNLKLLALCCVSRRATAQEEAAMMTNKLGRIRVWVVEQMGKVRVIKIMYKMILLILVIIKWNLLCIKTLLHLSAFTGDRIIALHRCSSI